MIGPRQYLKKAARQRPAAKAKGEAAPTYPATKIDIKRTPTSSLTWRSSMIAGMRFDGADDANAIGP